MTLEELIESGRITKQELKALWADDVKKWRAAGSPAGFATFTEWLEASGWLDD